MSVNSKEEQEKKVNKKPGPLVLISDLSPFLDLSPSPLYPLPARLWTPSHPRCRLSRPHQCPGHQDLDPQATAQDAPPLQRV